MCSLGFLSKLFIVKDKKHEDDNNKVDAAEDCCARSSLRFESNSSKNLSK
jgi:hypothetical protein